MYNKGKWLDSEIELVKKYYPLGGSDLCFEKGVKRPLGAIKNKANSLGIFLNTTSEKLTNEELSILKKYYPLGGYLLCLNMGLLNKNKQLVRNTAYKLGLKVKDYNAINNSVEIWREDEIWLLVKYYPIGGSELCIQKGLNRSSRSIGTKANRLNLSSDIRGTGALWEAWEEELLKKYYPIGGTVLCAQKGLNRTNGAMCDKAKILNLYFDNYGRRPQSPPPHIVPYEKWELDIITKYYPIGGVKLCVDKGLTSRKEKDIAKKAYRMGLRLTQRVKTSQEWTDKEFEILYSVYPIYGAKGCIVDGLNRSERAITHKANDLKLRRVISGNWTKEEDAILKKYYPQGGYTLCIEKGLNKKPDTMRNRFKFWETYQTK